MSESETPPTTPNKKCFESFAVFDLETNTLPDTGRRVSITELTIYGISKHDFIHAKDHNIPRIVNKLNLVCRPLGAIDPKAEKITGLSNYTLEKETTFNEKTCDMINLFFDHLQKPICLIAHYGDKFDFKVLKEHFRRKGKKFVDGLMSVDSIEAFKFIDQKIEKEQESKKVDESLGEALAQSDKMDFQKLNETTPKSSHIKVTSMTKEPKSKRSLFEATPSPKKPRTSYKLVDVYTRKTGEEPKNAHQSAGDVEMLMKSMLHYGEEFLNYCEENAVEF